MDISLSKQILETTIKSRTDELATLQLALDLLNGSFKVDFTNRDTAVNEANDLATKLSVEKNAHEATKAELVTEKNTTATLTAEKADLQTQLTAIVPAGIALIEVTPPVEITKM